MHLPRNIAVHTEDTCEYWIYFITQDLLSREDQVIHLNKILKDIKTQWTAWTKEYIWHKQPFSLSIREIPSPPHLHGKTQFGDCIDDEWLIVYLLRELTRKIKEAYVRIVDSDGEFLLIESAMVLPKWLDSKNSDYRVWINQSRLLIIPPEEIKKSKDIPPLTLGEAIFFIRNTPDSLIHNEKIEKHAFCRIKEYPQKMKENNHWTKVIVPRKIAHILHTDPNLISAATYEFYLRDPISLKACEKMKNFFPEDFVSVAIKTTKTLYAQLKGQQFHKHPLFKLPKPGSPSYDEAVMGMKITCGFEMLCAKTPKNHSTYTLKSDPNWIAFIEKLKLSGYFENEREGSAKYKSLEKHAEECYLKSYPFDSSNNTIHDPVLQIFDILKQTLPTDDEISQWPSACDNDDFLYINPDELDKLMYMRTKTSLDGDDNTQKKTKQDPFSIDHLESVAQKFENFVNDEDAGLDGVDIECDSFTDDTSTNSNISFNEEEFLKIMKETLDLSNEHVTKTKDNPVQNESTQDEPAIQDFMDAMDAELSSTTLKDSFSNPPAHKTHSIHEQNLKDVNINYNLLKNLFESIDKQHGTAGPAETLLKSMNLSLPSHSSTSDPSS